MNFKSIALGISTLVLSTNVSAALVTFGFLSTYDDGSSNIITDSLNNVEYLRLDVLADLNYNQTLAVLDSQDGGGWSIADSSVAVSFTNALLGGASSCSHNGSSVTLRNCGTVAGWYDGALGDNFTAIEDYTWFLDNNGEADYINVSDSGLNIIKDYSMVNSENFAFTGTDPDRAVSWLLVRAPSAVPVPAAVWLFGSGLLGLIGVARRKKS